MQTIKKYPSLLFAAAASLVAATFVGVGFFARRRHHAPSIMESLIKYNAQGF